MWRADGDETTEVLVQPAGAGQKPGSWAQELAAWARGNAELLSQLKQRAAHLMA